MRQSRRSTDYKVVPFTADHAEDLQARNTSGATIGLNHIVKEYLDAMALPGHGFSLVNNGHLIFSAGVYPVWKGLGEAWVIPSDLIKPHRRQLVTYVREYLDRLVEENEYRRVQATVRADFDAGHRFIEFLGFQREAMLEAYGPDGADHVQYARLMKW